MKNKADELIDSINKQLEEMKLELLNINNLGVVNQTSYLIASVDELKNKISDLKKIVMKNDVSFAELKLKYNSMPLNNCDDAVFKEDLLDKSVKVAKKDKSKNQWISEQYKFLASYYKSYKSNHLPFSSIFDDAMKIAINRLNKKSEECNEVVNDRLSVIYEM